MKKSDSVVVLVDGNWLINRAYSVYNKRKDVIKATCDAVINWSCEYALQLKATHLCVCLDGPKVFRYDVYLHYKANRRRKGDEESHPEGLNHQVDDTHTDRKNKAYDCLDLLVEKMSELGIAWYQDPTLEADDLMASAAYTFKGSVKKVWLVTLDKDINQCVDTNVSKFVPGVSGKPSTILTLGDVEKMSPYLTGAALVDYQTLIGDNTDNIPRLMSVKKAAGILQKHSSLKEFFRKEGQDFWTEHKDEVILNRKLVRLVPDGWKPKLEELEIRYAKHKLGAPRQWNELMGSLKLKASYRSLF